MIILARISDNYTAESLITTYDAAAKAQAANDDAVCLWPTVDECEGDSGAKTSGASASFTFALAAAAAALL